MYRLTLASLILASVLCANPAGIVITEIMYNPPGDDAALEFVEVHNRGPVIFDLSGYTLTGDIEFTFPEGTFLTWSSPPVQPTSRRPTRSRMCSATSPAGSRTAAARCA
jgi:hypothetical protein